MEVVMKKSNIVLALVSVGLMTLSASMYATTPSSGQLLEDHIRINNGDADAGAAVQREDITPSVK
jgi:hypothetical protein